MSEAEKQQWETQFRARLNEMLAARLGPLATEIGDQFAEARRTAEAALARERARRMDERAVFNAAIAEIDRQRTQAGVLSALVETAAQFAPRVVFFAVRGDRARGWKGRGLMDEAIAGLSLPLDSTTVVGDAIGRQQSIFFESGRESGLESGLESGFESGFESGAGDVTRPEYRPVIDNGEATSPVCTLAIPIVIRGKAAAALYADADTAEALDLQPLEALARIAGMTIELLPLRRSTEPLTSEVVPPRVFTSRPRVTTDISGKGEVDTAPAERDQQAEEYTEVPDTAPLGLPEAVDVPPPPPPPIRITEYGAAAEAAAEAPPSDALPSDALPSDALPSDALIDDPRAVADARRYARFLVSEIKLYHQGKVAEGLRRADLFERLREEIERNRQLYDRHVSARITAEFDYFYDELVQTLADGDADKLGRDHPRPANRANAEDAESRTEFTE